MRKGIWAIAPLSMLCACTTSLKTEHVSQASSPKPGVLYNLPMATFDVEAKFLVTSCVLDANGIAQIGYQMTEGSIKHNLAPDALETYRLDYGLLNSALKTTTASVVLYPNGMIKTVNADVDDRTSQVLTSLAGTVVNLYKASTLSLVPVAAAGAKPCDKFLLDKIDNRRAILEQKIPEAKPADKELSDDRDAADESSVALEEAKLKLAEAQKGKDNVAIAAATKEVASAQAKLNVALAKLKDRKFQLPKLQAQLTALTSSLTATAKMVNWAPRAGANATEICQEFSTDQAVFLRQLALASGEKLVTQPAPNAKFKADACVELAPNPRLSPDAVNKEKDATEANYEGVVYRLPSSGTASVRDSQDPSQRFYSTSMVSLPQFGAKGLVWLKNQAFDKNTVKASFNEDGSMSELTFTAQSRAERAAATAMDLSKSVVDLMQLRADATKAKAAAADAEEKKAHQKQIDALDQQIAILDKQKALEAARNPSKDSYDKEKELLQKEIDVEKLRQELDELKKKRSAS